MSTLVPCRSVGDKDSLSRRMEEMFDRLTHDFCGPDGQSAPALKPGRGGRPLKGRWRGVRSERFKKALLHCRLCHRKVRWAIKRHYSPLRARFFHILFYIPTT